MGIQLKITGDVQRTASNALVPNLKLNRPERASFHQNHPCPQDCGHEHQQMETANSPIP